MPALLLKLKWKIIRNQGNWKNLFNYHRKRLGRNFAFIWTQIHKIGRHGFRQWWFVSSRGGGWVRSINKCSISKYVTYPSYTVLQIKYQIKLKQDWDSIRDSKLRNVGDGKLSLGPRVKRSSRSKTFQCETTRWKLLRKVKLGETDELYCSTHDDMTTFKCQTLSYSWDHLTFSGLPKHCLTPIQWKFWPCSLFSTNQKTADLAENYSCVIGM